MFKSLSKLFGRQPNPTAEWPAQMPSTLVYDLRSRSLNGLKLDGAFADARSFGRCDDFERYDQYLDLFYRANGFSLGFGDDQLLGVILVVGRNSHECRVEKFGVCSPALIDMNGNRHAMTETTIMADLIPYLGQPKYSDPSDLETTESFIVNKNFVEASFDLRTGGLLSLDICLAKDE